MSRYINVDDLLKDNAEKLSYDSVKYTYEYGFVVTVEDLLKAPAIEPLTDVEQRIFLAAMGREEKVCKKADEEFEAPYAYKLEFVCREITRKVKEALWTN